MNLLEFVRHKPMGGKYCYRYPEIISEICYIQCIMIFTTCSWHLILLIILFPLFIIKDMTLFIFIQSVLCIYWYFLYIHIEVNEMYFTQKFYISFSLDSTWGCTRSRKRLLETLGLCLFVCSYLPYFIVAFGCLLFKH